MARRPRRPLCPSLAAEPHHAFVHCMSLLLLFCGVGIPGATGYVTALPVFRTTAVCKEMHDLNH